MGSILGEGMLRWMKTPHKHNLKKNFFLISEVLAANSEKEI
jgi:hypothetical protein